MSASGLSYGTMLALSLWEREREISCPHPSPLPKGEGIRASPSFAKSLGFGPRPELKLFRPALRARRELAGLRILRRETCGMRIDSK